MIIKSYWVIYFVVFGYVSLFSQNADTILQQHLQGITVKGYKFPFRIQNHWRVYIMVTLLQEKK
ncbi:MAG: hypothetical protein IPG79_18735 [Saprospiraceae bacterium]|nr:hypothetical protein [Saprospiraceae bacterium]